MSPVESGRATAAPPAPESEAGAPGLAKALAGAAMSLFVCPGFGHRLLGRKKAYQVILASFLIAVLVLGLAVYQFVQEAVAGKGGPHRVPQFDKLLRQATDYLQGDTLGGWSLTLLLTIYFGAPLELLFTWFRSREDIRKN